MELPNLTALETVSQSKFWLLWTIFVAISIMSGFVNNYQKTFGMKFITDDFFFTYVGLASNLINGSSRIIWGYVYDLKGFKVIFIRVNCHNIIFLFFFIKDLRSYRLSVSIAFHIFSIWDQFRDVSYSAGLVFSQQSCSWESKTMSWDFSLEATQRHHIAGYTISCPITGYTILNLFQGNFHKKLKALLVDIQLRTGIFSRF